MDQSPARIVVGIVDDQPAEVLTTAADYARRFDAELILARVDDSKYTVEVRPDGTVASLHEFFNGSVAIQLAHRQHRPLVVVPMAEGGME